MKPFSDLILNQERFIAECRLVDREMQDLIYHCHICWWKVEETGLEFLGSREVDKMRWVYGKEMG
jgi:hypothetical protein